MSVIKYGFVLLGFVGATLAFKHFHSSGGHQSPADWKTLAEEANKDLPTQFNADAVLNSVYFENNELRYSGTLTGIPASKVPPTVVSSIPNEVIATVCKNQTKTIVHQAFHDGVAITYVFWGSDKGYITEVKVQASDCK